MNDTAERSDAADRQSDTQDKRGEWYAVNTFAKQEKEGAEAVEQFAEKYGYTDRIIDVLAPQTTKKEVEDGDTVKREEALFDGYFFIKAELSRELVHKIKQIDKITGFVGSGPDGSPIPVPDEEIAQIQEELDRDEPTIDIEFEEGDTVRITGGAMDDMTGTVKEIDLQSNKLKVSVDMFGRETEAEVDFDKAELID